MKKSISVLLAVILILSSAVGVSAYDGGLDGLIGDVGEYLYKSVPEPTFGSVGGEWAVLGLSRSELDIPGEYYENYYRRISEYTAEKNGILHKKKYTEYSRVILALSAMGKNPQNVGGYDLTEPLADFDGVVNQGINGPVWALIALDCRGYELSQKSRDTTRKTYVEYILEKQLPDGGWSMSGTESEVDITAMALVSLSNYRDDENVEKAVSDGVDFLSGVQNDNGGFSGGGEENAESCAQAATALSALGISVNDERFLKNGNSVLDAIMGFRASDGGFRHTHGAEKANQMATEQCFYALVSIWRFENGKTGLYSMSDVVFDDVTESEATGLKAKHPDVVCSEVLFREKSFSDIKNHKNQKAVEELAKRGIINGKTDELFEPDQTMTRAEFAAVVVRGLGLEKKGENKFSDVSKNDWFYDYVCVAHNYGIIKGVSEDLFNPGGTITREEAGVMTQRAAKLCGMDTDISENEARDVLAGFSDYIKISDWAFSSMAFCCRDGILSDDEVKIEPKKSAARGEIAEMLWNVLCFSRLIRE